MSDENSTPPEAMEESIYEIGKSPQIYSNHAGVRITPYDIEITFNKILDLKEEKLVIREMARVVVSPTYAKSLHSLLGRQIALYEKNWGPIVDVESTLRASPSAPEQPSEPTLAALQESS